jgi:RimJ/RimL family protein N-acetyltransferase
VIDAESNDDRTAGDAAAGPVSLRPIAEDDIPEITGRLADPAAVGDFQWFGWQDPHRMRREWAEHGLLRPDRGLLLVARGAAACGFVSWRKIERGTCFYWNMGILLWPHARGKGVGTEAQRLLARYLFAHSLAARVEADTEVDNIAEQRALEKAGFTREGVLRRTNFRDGRWRDAVLYSILREDLSPTA